MKRRILIVDDEEIFLVQLKMALKGMGLEISTARNGTDALHKLEQKDFNIVLTDLKMPGMDGLQLLENIRKSYPHIYVVIVTAYGEIPQVVQAMRLGAYDFIQKPFDINLLELSLKKILQTHALMEENVSLRREVEERYDFHQIVGKNHRMKRVYELITLAAGSDTTTLIRGETGTGKELVAKAIHYHSPRKKKPLITVNCVAIPETLLESELFGHEKGAFTGAHNRKIGSFELADQGTLFLDEIGDCPLPLQGKLLRFLQEKEIRRVGGNRIINIDARVISATNQNLEEWVKQGKFREDLYYRINVLSIHLPPLRERLDDIPFLASHFLKKYGDLFGKGVKDVSPEALNSLFQYHWPGNIRELENVIEKSVVTEKGATIQRFDLSSISEASPFSRQTNLPLPLDTGMPFREMKEGLIHAWESEYLKASLSKNRGNITQAARQSGLNYKTFYEKLVKYGLERKEFL
ncbi:MAG: sigma-54-dependent Fis family transcriptional regulator [Deltaproteobacteria bacterium]|jgi:DNA-binding NtrC family response regulator|nr:MAG: sigma-54-dependent Fis family transcriptional regulator [Deltaproteobacteria bacterium]